jgi:dipeptidyl-peptidase-4
VKTVPIWLSEKYDGRRPTGEYHPGAGWIQEQGRHRELHQCVEFTNIPIFEQEVQRMPMMVLHELAHEAVACQRQGLG